MQADIDELIHVKLEGEIADLLVKMDPSYAQYVTKEQGKSVIYTKLNKALYGTLQGAFLFWKKLSAYLLSLAFEKNPYDDCVMNKMVNGKQCTIAWHVDDLKLSHMEEKVVEDLIDTLNLEFGKEAELVVHHGKVHDYFGMILDFLDPGKIKVKMDEYVLGMLSECPEELIGGSAETQSANPLFHINDDATKLDSYKGEIYHHLVAKLLYLSKRARPDVLLAVSFLCTRVQGPDVDHWMKLRRCMTYLSKLPTDHLTLEASPDGIIQRWVDSSYGVHKDCKSHTGACMSLGRGSAINISTKQKLNTRSSTEAELVGVNDAMALVLWTRMFLEVSLSTTTSSTRITKALSCLRRMVVLNPVERKHATLKFDTTSLPTTLHEVLPKSTTVQLKKCGVISSQSLSKEPYSKSSNLGS